MASPISGRPDWDEPLYSQAICRAIPRRHRYGNYGEYRRTPGGGWHGVSANRAGLLQPPRLGKTVAVQQAAGDLGPCAQSNGSALLRGSRGTGLYHAVGQWERVLRMS